MNTLPISPKCEGTFNVYIFTLPALFFFFLLFVSAWSTGFSVWFCLLQFFLLAARLIRALLMLAGCIR